MSTEYDEVARWIVERIRRAPPTRPVPSIETSEAERLWKIAQNDADRQESMRHLLIAVENQCPVANYIYAQRLLRGDGVAVDATKALDHASRAAVAGFAEAQYLVHALLQRTVFQGTDRCFSDPELEYQYFKMAADNGCVVAQAQFGALLCNNPDTKAEGVRYLKLASHAVVPADEQLRIKEYMNSDARQIQSLCDGSLAEYYWKLGPTRNTRLAIHYWRRSAERGNIESMYSLGKVLRGEVRDEELEGLEERDMEAGFRYIRESADAGFDYAQYDMGKMLGRGEAGPVDTERAYYYMEKAARSGFAPAEYIWGLVLWGRNDYSTAVQYFQRSASKGNADAITMIRQIQSAQPTGSTVAY